MIILLSGADDYRRLKRKQAIVAEFVRRHSALAIAEFDAGTDEGQMAFQEFLGTPSLFAPVRLAVFRDTYEEERAAYIGDLKAAAVRPDITILISERNRPTKKFAFLASTKGEGKTKNIDERFEPITGAAWRAYAKRECAARGVALTLDAFTLLALATEGDGWRLATELEKLKGVAKQPVSRAALGALGIDEPPVFWDLVNALRGGALAPRLAALAELFGAKEPAGKVFNMLAYQWPSGIASAAALDLAVKRGKMEYEEALLALALG